MPPAPIPQNEIQRLAALHDLRILDSEPNAAFNALVEAASLLCGTPIALISLVDEQRQWFKAKFGLETVSETPRDMAFCAHAILGDDIFEVKDARRDPRFADNPLVLGAPNVGFYAGVPLKLQGGENIGTLCVLDHQPRELDANQTEILLKLGTAAARAMELWRSEQLLIETTRDLRQSEEFLARTGRLAGVGGWSLEPETGKLIWSPETYKIHGVPEDLPLEMDSALSFYAPEAKEAVLTALQRTRYLGEPFDLELPLIRSDGWRRWVRSMGEQVVEPGKPHRIVGAFQDITAQHHLAAELAQQNELMKVTLRSIADAVITTDAEGFTSWLNPVAERLIGRTEAEAVGQPLSTIFVVIDETTGESVDHSIQAFLQQADTEQSQQKKIISNHGETYALEESIAPIRNEEGTIIGTVVVFRDVTQQRRLSSEMTFRATHDTLTGLLNRGELERRLTFLLHKAHVDETESCILFIDLDQFKLVNDACGHQAGDQLLVQVGKLLSGVVRASDAVARLGGDEFAILLDRCPIPNGRDLAQQICDRMERFRFSHNNKRFRVGTSIGMVTIDHRWQDVFAILHAADACCYAAKAAGRNRVHIWSETDAGIKSRDDEALWAARLEQALDDDRFVLFAQRIHSFDRPNGGLHAEVLLRLRDPEGRLLPPGAFLPAAERFHICSRIDRWVLSKALSWMRAQRDVEAIDLLAINLSGQSIGDAAFQSWILAELAEAGPRIAQRICLEITETAAITNLADASAFIERLKAIRVRVALDDFGAGVSSFGYLKSMNVDFLKIDGQFVRDILTDKLDKAAVACFVQIAEVVGMQTIAEFTETAEIMAELKAMGVHFAQGYHIHKPAPIDELTTPHHAPATLQL